MDPAEKQALRFVLVVLAGFLLGVGFLFYIIATDL